MKQLYALVCETQRYSAVLDAVIANAGLLRAEKKLRPHLAKVTEGCMLSRFSRVRLSATPWTVARQAPLSMGFSR